VDEATIRYWVKHGVQEDKRKANGKTSDFEEIEKDLLESLLSMRKKGLAVTSNVIYKEMKNLIIKHFKINQDEYKLLQNYARYCPKKDQKHNAILTIKSNEIFCSYNDKDEEINLTKDEIIKLRDAYLSCQQKLVIIDKNWLHRFTKKNKLSYRKITHLSPKTPAEVELDVLEFLSEVYEMRKNNDIPLELILNFDETAIFFDQLPSYTYEQKGTSHPMLKTSKVQKKRLTAGLTITATGEKLNPLLIFKGSGTRFNKLHNFCGFILKKNHTAWNTMKIFLDYINQVIKPFVFSQRLLKPELKGKTALLIIDNFSGHKLDDKDVQSLKNDGILIKFLRPYTTNLCQPLDLNINYILKSRMKESWIDWFSNNPGENPAKQVIYSWFRKGFESITPLNIIKAFLLSGISNNPDGTEDILSPNIMLLRNKQFTNMAANQQEALFYEDLYNNPEHQDYGLSWDEKCEYYYDEDLDNK